MAEFEREDRYLVLKRTDLLATLDFNELRTLENLSEKVAHHRQTLGKPALLCVVVEGDWPEHEVVWDMIRQRSTGDARGLAQVRAAFLSGLPDDADKALAEAAFDAGAAWPAGVRAAVRFALRCCASKMRQLSGYFRGSGAQELSQLAYLADEAIERMGAFKQKREESQDGH